MIRKRCCVSLDQIVKYIYQYEKITSSNFMSGHYTLLQISLVSSDLD